MRTIRSVNIALSILFFASGVATAQHRQLLEGDRLYEQGQYEKAISAYRAAGTGVALYNAGNAAYQQGKYQVAASLYREAVSKSVSYSDRSDALYNLGNALMRQEKYKEAVAAYEQSLRLLPNRPDAKKNLQIAKRQMVPPPPTPTTPPPPPPPPPSRPPRQYYLDKPRENRKGENPPANLPPATALRMLESAVLPEEQKNAGLYRELSPAARPSNKKKDW
ncbi:MAG: tetratricopeptide repeat protein [Saprospiraceae bacterium]